jgi:hypothetical protein
VEHPSEEPEDDRPRAVRRGKPDENQQALM